MLFKVAREEVLFITTLYYIFLVVTTIVRPAVGIQKQLNRCPVPPDARAFVKIIIGRDGDFRSFFQQRRPIRHNVG